MGLSRQSVLFVLAGALCSAHARAQVPAAPSSVPIEARSEARSGPAEARSQANPAPGIELPEVTDPMLQPPAAAARQVHTWQEAIALVRARSTNLATARAQFDAAAARSDGSRSNLLPTASAVGQVNRALLFATGLNLRGDVLEANVRIPDPATIWTGSLNVQQRILDPRSVYDRHTAQLAVRAAAAGGVEAERLALATLADAMVGVFTAERVAEVSRVSLRSNLSVLDLTQRRARLGAASAVDVLRVQQEVATNRGAVLQSAEALRRAYETLGVALGFPEAFGIAPGLTAAGLAEDAAHLCTPIAGGVRSDVQAAQLDYSVAERAVASSGYGYAPVLSVGSAVSYSTQPNAARPSQWTVGAALTVPLYDGGRLSAERATSSANAAAVQQRLTATERQAALEAVQAQRGVDVALADYEISKKAREISAESARLSQIAFVHGTGTSFDLVDSARRLLLAEIDVAIKEFTVVRSRIAAVLAVSNCSL
jgi:outer membrane protein, multidrug efflux system